MAGKVLTIVAVAGAVLFFLVYVADSFTELQKKQDSRLEQILNGGQQ